MIARLPAVLGASVLSVLSWVVQADLPVHCLRHQVVGDWQFTLGPAGQKRSSCGHLKPDNQDKQPSMDFLSSQGATTTKKFTLSDPNSASSEDGSAGTWTMIYDEGFEVAIGDSTFFAFSKFEWVQSPKGKTNISHCDQTEIGWYHDTTRDSWGCYFGQKVNIGDVQAQAPPADAAPAASNFSSGPHDSLFELAASMPAEPQQQAAAPAVVVSQLNQPAFAALASFLAIPKSPTVLVQAPSQTPPASLGYDMTMSSQFQQDVADALNFLQLGWTASAYQNHRFFNGRTPRELNRAAGLRRAKPHDRSAALPTDPSSFLGVNSKIRRVSADEASGLDYRNKDGKNWLTPVVNQGDCGSCYTISTVHMLTARNRIRAQDPGAPAFSMAFPLYCSEYNQGCDGGYGFLQSKWSEDVGLIPENCAPFSDGGGSCQVSSSCGLGAKRYRASGHHYVGGFYGGADAEQMRLELTQAGPMVVSFEPKEDFMYYKGGIYKSGARPLHPEWEQVDHAVLLVGYGAEGDQAFWSVQNSWGDDWGEDGYFRMARGDDESGIEGIAVAANVIEEDSNPVLDDFLASL